METMPKILLMQVLDRYGHGRQIGRRIVRGLQEQGFIEKGNGVPVEPQHGALAVVLAAAGGGYECQARDLLDAAWASTHQESGVRLPVAINDWLLALARNDDWRAWEHFHHSELECCWDPFFVRIVGVGDDHRGPIFHPPGVDPSKRMTCRTLHRVSGTLMLHLAAAFAGRSYGQMADHMDEIRSQELDTAAEQREAELEHLQTVGDELRAKVDAMDPVAGILKRVRAEAASAHHHATHGG